MVNVYDDGSSITITNTAFTDHEDRAIYLNTYGGANAEIIDSTFTNNNQGIYSQCL